MSKPVLFALSWKAMLVLAVFIWFITHRHKSVYLVDFACFQPPDSWKVSPEQAFEILRIKGTFNEGKTLTC